MKNDGKPWRAELLKDLGEAAAAVLREGLSGLKPEIVDQVHSLLGRGLADIQIITVMGATGTAGVICALTRRDADPVVLFRIDLSSPNNEAPETTH
jgi:hypothetical protein